MSALNDVIRRDVNALLFEAKQKGSSKLPQGLVSSSLVADGMTADKIVESNFLTAIQELGIPERTLSRRTFRYPLDLIGDRHY